MKYPNFSEEKKLWKSGSNLVAGLDEVGRGPLAGPVVAAAVIFEKGFCPIELNVRDSKQLSLKQREKVFKILVNHPRIKWGVGKVSEKVIDKINILEATKLAMIKAIKDLACHPSYIILDGNFKIESNIPQKSVIKGDVKVFSCAAASIIAKVTRDRIMLRYDKKYPKYKFRENKGYPTEYHRKVLLATGPCPIHRKSFSY